jgi:predicted dehydrogenase
VKTQQAHSIIFFVISTGKELAMQPIRWGILGRGGIANSFAQGLRALPDAQLLAVGSRSAQAAEAFGEQYGVPHRYGSYAALVQDPDVDVIYVATPHPFHRDHSLLAMRAGKAVLCEKPLTVNARQAAELIEYARAQRLFLMQAMWTRFLPAIGRLRQLLADGVIGEVRLLQADFSFRADFDPHHRLFDPALGGGALLDAGIYPLSLASMVFGRPAAIASQAHLGATGVDEQAAVVLKYEAGQLAVLTMATRTAGPQTAVIRGTEGYITLPPEWLRATRLVITRPGQPDEVVDRPLEGNGYNYEAAETMRCLRGGLVESDVMPLDETLALMQTLDAIRAQWGLKYPGE